MFSTARVTGNRQSTLVRWIMASALAGSVLGASAFAGDEPSDAKSIKVMFYNAYNLFDVKHDEGKDDWTFLPANFPGKTAQCRKIKEAYYRDECLKTDWTEEKFQLKLAQLEKAIRAAGPQLPDAIGLCEVENREVVEALAQRLGFRNVAITDSPDVRGIDVALMYNEKLNFKHVRELEHVIGASNAPDLATRNILEVEFNIGQNEHLYVFVNHWPSQRGPATLRHAAATELMKAAKERLSTSTKAHVLAMGDFNTVPEDYPHPFNDVVLKPNDRLHLMDVHQLFLTDQRTDPAVRKALPYGTYFYVPQMAWNRLDRFFVSQSLNNNDARGPAILPQTYRILALPELSRAFRYESAEYFGKGTVIQGVPVRGNFGTTSANDAGFSDHFPVSVELRTN